MIGKLLLLLPFGERVVKLMADKKMMTILVMLSIYLIVSIKCAMITQSWTEMQQCEVSQFDVVKKVMEAVK